MGYSSQAGQVILRTQDTPGTLASDLGTAGVAVKLRSGSLAANRDLLIPDPEIGGGRDTADAYLGAVSFSGDYEFYPRLESITTLLRAALGTANSAAATGVNTHTITPSDAAQLPMLSVEEKIGDGLETFNYTDAVVNTFHLESEANGYLQGTAGLIAKRQVAGVTPTTDPDWDNTPLIVGTNITVTFNGVTIPAKSFSLDVNNNFEDDDFRLGSFFLGDLTPKSREVTASISVRHDGGDLWRQATYGQASAVTPGGIITKGPLVISMKTYETIAGSTPPTVGSLDIAIGQAVLTPFGYSPSGDDVLENDIDIRGIRPNPATPILSAVVKNGRADIA
ncbi:MULTISPECIES: phage tail tube protein [Streptomyces]|uniref:phage tail tube protein n=1 Tax=Streptomyces TaxID=1883 RepID=UPI0036486837